MNIRKTTSDQNDQLLKCLSILDSFHLSFVIYDH